MRVKLTKNRLRTLSFDPDGPQTQWVWDESQPGFGVRLLPSGRMSYVVSYRNSDGRVRHMSLKPTTRMTLDQARKRARALLGEIAGNRDADPVAERHALRVALWRDYRAAYVKHCRARGNKTWKAKARLLELHTGDWDARYLPSITRQDVARLHHKLGTDQPARSGAPARAGTPHLANRVLATVKNAFNVAHDITGLPESHANPATRIKPFPEHSRKRRVDKAELPALLKAIGDETNEAARNLFMLLLLTGMRRGEALSLQWANWDRRRNVLTVANTKQGTPHSYPLNKPAVAHVEAMFEARDKKSKWLFPGAEPKKALVNPDKAWRRVKERAQLPGLRLHDLRRTVGSWLADDNVSLRAIGSVLGHRNQSTTAVYARLSEDVGANVMEQYGQRVLAIVDGGKKSKGGA